MLLVLAVQLPVFPVFVMLLVLVLAVQILAVLVWAQLPLYRKQTLRARYPRVCVSLQSC